jgi:hypothetical protein
MRDDNRYRARYNAAAYYTGASAYTLGAVNNPTNTNWVLDKPYAGDCPYSYPIATFQSGLRDIGNLGQIYFAASTLEGTTATPFTKNVIDFNPSPTGSVLFTPGVNSQTAPGRLDPRANVNPGGGVYPDVPKAAMLNEFLTLLPGDSLRTDNPNRVYGKINVNTATREALMQLPLLSLAGATFNAADGTPITIPATFNKAAAIEYILAYRDQRQAVGGPDYTLRATNDTRINGINGLRVASPFHGFLTPGEVAIPLSDYAHSLMQPGGIPYPYAENMNITKAAGYVDVRDAMYRSISNLITVNSDVFVVNMMLKVQPANATATTAAADLTRPRWYYVAVIDRGNCMAPTDTPAVLLFAEVK